MPGTGRVIVCFGGYISAAVCERFLAMARSDSFGFHVRCMGSVRMDLEAQCVLPVVPVDRNQVLASAAVDPQRTGAEQEQTRQQTVFTYEMWLVSAPAPSPKGSGVAPNSAMVSKRQVRPTTESSTQTRRGITASTRRWRSENCSFPGFKARSPPHGRGPVRGDPDPGAPLFVLGRTGLQRSLRRF